MHLQTIARAVKDGVLAAGGTPMEFNTIGVCDGIAMGHDGMHFSLSSRELIADTIECMVKAHCFDALVFIPNCDKIVPGMLMAAMRLNLPCIFVSGGPMLSINQRDLNTEMCIRDRNLSVFPCRRSPCIRRGCSGYQALLCPRQPRWHGGWRAPRGSVSSYGSSRWSDKGSS